MSLLEGGPPPPTLVVALSAATIAVALPQRRLRLVHPYTQQLQRLAELGSFSEATGVALSTFLLLVMTAATYLFVAGGMTILAAVVAALSSVVVGWALSLYIRRRERLIRNQLAEFAQHMSGATRASLTPAPALESALRAAPPLLASLLGRASSDYQRGTPLTDALERVSDRVRLDALSLFVKAVGVSLSQGSRLDEALSRIAASIRNQQALEDKLAALTASGRTAIATLAVFPYGFGLFFYRLEPAGYEKAFSIATGQAAAAACLVVTFLGVWWGNRILNRVGA